MIISKNTLESCLADLPDTIGTEDVMYRLYLMEKIEAGEQDIRDGRTSSHDEVLQRLSQKRQG